MAKGVLVALATKSAWGQVRHADNYLRGELEKQKADGIEKTQSQIYDGLNCDRDNFTKTCMLYMKQYGEKKVKAYEYVQSFHADDKANGLTSEKAHKLGMDYARKYFGEYPTLVVTHIDTDHIHNQILVGNVNADNGKSLQINAKTLVEMKQYIGQQCEQAGFFHSTWEKKKEKELWEQKSKNEYLMKSQGKATDKEQIAYVVRNIRDSGECRNLEDLKKQLQEKYDITIRNTKNSISFSHPDMKRPVRGERLGKDLTKGEIERGIENSNLRGNQPSRDNETIGAEPIKKPNSVDTRNIETSISDSQQERIIGNIELGAFESKRAEQELARIDKERANIGEREQGIKSSINVSKEIESDR